MNIKKFNIPFVLFISVCLIFSQISTVFAVSNIFMTDIVLEEYEEIKDPEILKERAKNNISDRKIPEIKQRLEAKSKNTITGEEISHEIYETTQLLKVSKDKQGQIKKQYATTLFVTAKYPETNGNTISNTSKPEFNLSDNTTEDFQAMANYTRTVYTPRDKNYATNYSGDVDAYLTIYYEEYGANSLRHYKVTGYWKILVGNISLSEAKVVSKSWGPSNYTDPKWVSQITSTVLTTHYFSPGFSHSFYYLRPIEPVGAWNLGSRSQVKVTRGGSSWIFYLSNTLSDFNF